MAKRSKSDEVRALESEIRKLQSQLRQAEASGSSTDEVLSNLEDQRRALEDQLDLERQRADLITDMLGGSIDLTAMLSRQADSLLIQSTTMSSILGIGVLLLGQAVKLDNTFSDIAKSLDISANEARKLTVETKLTNEYSGLAGNNYENISESLGAIKGTFGVITEDAREQAGLLAVIGKNLNLSAEEQGAFALAAEATNQSTEGFAKNIAAAVKAFPLLQRAGIRLSTIMTDISEASSDTLRNFAGQSTELIKAAVQTRLMGISLGQADKVATSLLNIESSLAGEAEARVLSGQQLNFDQARYLAVTKGIEEAASNVLEQTGGLAKFSKLNRLAQESIAESLGLQTGELFDILTKQQAIATLGAKQVEQLTDINSLEATRIINNENIEDASLQTFINQQSQIGVQERFNDLVLKMQEIVVSMVTPILPVLESLISFLGTSTGRVLLDLALLGSGIALTATGAGAPAGIGLIAAGGLGLVGEAVSSSKKVNDMVITPGGQVYETSPQDFLIATKTPGQVGGSNGELTAKVNETNTLLRQIAAGMSSPVNIQVGEQVINSMGKINDFRRSFGLGFDNTYGKA